MYTLNTRIITLAGLAIFANPCWATLTNDDHHADAPSSHSPAPKAEPKSLAPASKSAASSKKPKSDFSQTESSGKAPAAMHDNQDSAGERPAHAESAAQIDKPASEHAATASTASSPAFDDVVNSAQALRYLQEGNARWASGKSESPSTDARRRQDTAANGQHPFASILTCSDSRLPVERVFDRGIGELFVVRVAGNVAGTSEAGTLEYGVSHLKTPLLVVMGHTKCGAVAAAVSGAHPAGALGELVNSIGPAVDRAKKNNPDAPDADVPALAVRENVWQTVFALLKRSPEIRAQVASGQLQVVGAICDVSTGKVEFLGQHPWQDELVAAFNERAQGATRQATAESEPVHGH